MDKAFFVWCLTLFSLIFTPYAGEENEKLLGLLDTVGLVSTLGELILQVEQFSIECRK